MTRAALVVGALGALLLGLAAGLRRLGWPLPAAPWAAVHGPLLVPGFFGTLISLERAVAVGRPWAFAAPAAHALAVLALVAGHEPLAAACASAGALALGLVYAAALRTQPAAFLAVEALGAVDLLMGNVVWGFDDRAAAVPWWMGFLVLTIAGERLELSRLRQPGPRAALAFAGALLPLLVGPALIALTGATGWRVLGAGWILLAAWLLRHDVARLTVRQRGLPRFIAVALLAGYGWLLAAGALALGAPPPPAGPLRDAVLHALFVGFVLGMVLAHAPILAPVLLERPLTYGPRLYAPLALLHLGTLARIVGDLSSVPALRRGGALLSALALLAFGLLALARRPRGAPLPRP